MSDNVQEFYLCCPWCEETMLIKTGPFSFKCTKESCQGAKGFKHNVIPYVSKSSKEGLSNGKKES